MLAARVRSGLIETVHEGAVAVAGRDGSIIARSGDIDRPFFLRSAAKPFQAAVTQAAGAELRPVELALASASHAAEPAHIAIVAEMLASFGLQEDDLACPPAWPIGESARHRLAASGFDQPRRIWNNCSGKHSSWLRACVANGWDTPTYLDPEHPLQRRIIQSVAEWGNQGVGPVGIDGCGAPVLRTTVAAMATMFSRLATEQSLNEVFTAMHRYPSLVSGPGLGDAVIAVSLNAAAKGGAEGCIGVALGNGFGVAVKSWDGSQMAAEMGAIAALETLGMVTPAAATALSTYASPPVLGGGVEVGRIESRLELSMR